MTEVLRRQIRHFRFIVFALLVLTSGACLASLPLFDVLEHEGRVSTLAAWMKLPPSAKLQQIRMNKRCSRIGDPRGKWLVSDGRLWLTGLVRCGGEIPLSDAYEGNSGPVFADWVTMELVTDRGEFLCHGWNASGIRETTLKIRIEDGHVRQITSVSNAGHPAIPSKTDKEWPMCKTEK